MCSERRVKVERSGGKKKKEKRRVEMLTRHGENGLIRWVGVREKKKSEEVDIGEKKKKKSKEMI